MAQLVTKLPSDNVVNIPTSTIAQIPGLLATILTGAGWVKLKYSISMENTYGGGNSATLVLYIDGIPIPFSQRKLDTVQSYTVVMAGTFPIKPGAGQHTFALYGLAAQANMIIYYQRGNFTVEEPGY